MLDLNLARIAKTEYEERLREAELYRRFQHVQGQQPNLLENLLLSLSQILIESGTQLKQRVEMRPSLR
jgi:hypothetical protein